MSGFEVVAVPVLSDNFAYVVYSKATHKGVLIDPVDPEKVLEVVHKHSVQLIASLTTHHHSDHSGGNRWLRRHDASLSVISGRGDGCPHVTREVRDGDVLDIDENVRINVYQTPCHTSGHVLYHVISSSEGALFTGDTLFIGGCGRFFEGNAKQMDAALNGVIARLPPDTQIYCGHEYTVSNLRFAEFVEPNNAAVKKKLRWAEARRVNGLFTIPSSVAEELSFNPFMRLGEPAVKVATGREHPIDVMDTLRTMKNSFRP